MASTETIVALSSAPGKAGVAVLRLSGDGTAGIVQALTAMGLPEPRRAGLRRLSDPANGQPVDQALLLWFPGPSSFTGEDVAELHCHGSLAVIDRLLALCQQLGARLAEPGEFTRRAFTHQKIDLTSAEGLEDLIDAETEAQRVQAFAVADGAVRRRYEGWKDELLALMAVVEVGIDFAEEDLPAGLDAEIGRRRAALLASLAEQLQRGQQAERLRRGVRIVLLGPPNAGKSTLLNALAQRDVAIVSDIPGTTRDQLEVALDLAGVPVLLTDTAGLRRDSSDPIEQLGMARSRHAAAQADLLIWVSEAEPPPVDLQPDLIVQSKSDLGLAAPVPGSAAAPRLLLSVHSGAGLENLLAWLSERARVLTGSGLSGDAVSGRQRHQAALSRLQAALLASATAPLPELAAEELRLGLRELERLLGTVDVEELLDHLFSGFCIGK